MDTQEFCTILAAGHPGAETVLKELLDDSMFNYIQYFTLLSVHEITGEDIWLLYEKSDFDLSKFKTALNWIEKKYCETEERR